MSAIAGIFMAIICSVVWGGFALLATRMAWREREKATASGDGETE